jgi:hypothetical protein
MPCIRRVKCAMISIVLAAVGATSALAVQLFDNWNTGACALTDTATLSFPTPVRLDRFEVWYSWRANEASVAYTVSFDNQVIGSGTLVRADCDPYQTNWCVARDEPGAAMVAGTYTFRIAHANVCQNAGSSGQGFIRAFGSQQ